MLRTLFVIAILVPGLVAAVASRFAALLLYLWYSLFRPQDWLWIDITPLRVSLLLSLLVVIPRGWLLSDSMQSMTLKQRLAREAWPNLSHPLTLAMVLFFGTSLLAQVHAVDQRTGLLWIDYLWRVFLVAMVAVSLINTRERFTAVLAVMTASLGFHATKAGLSSLVGGGVRFDQGLGGAFIDNNGYAMAVVMILPFLVASGQNAQSRWLRWVFWASVLPCFYTVVSTFSRAGFLAAVTVVLAFAALQRQRLAALSGLAVVGLVGVLLVPVPQGYLDRLETIQTYEEVGEESALSRLHFWRVAIEMVRNRPFGVGVRNYDSAYDSYDFSGGHFGSGRSVHSSHFQVLAENGYAGFALWVLSFAYAFIVCLQIRTRVRRVGMPEEHVSFYMTMANGLMVSMVGFLVGGAFIALALNDLTWMTFALVASLDRLSVKDVAAAAGQAPADHARPSPSSGEQPSPDGEGRFRGSYRMDGR